MLGDECGPPCPCRLACDLKLAHFVTYNGDELEHGERRAQRENDNADGTQRGRRRRITGALDARDEARLEV